MYTRLWYTTASIVTREFYGKGACVSVESDSRGLLIDPNRKSIFDHGPAPYTKFHEFVEYRFRK
jgi:hypothetical protein